MQRLSITGTLNGGDHRSCFARPGSLHPRARLFPGIPTHCPRPRGGGEGARSAGGEELLGDILPGERGSPSPVPAPRGDIPTVHSRGRSRRRTRRGSSPDISPGTAPAPTRVGGRRGALRGGWDEGQAWSVSLESMHSVTYPPHRSAPTWRQMPHRRLPATAPGTSPPRPQ